MLSSTLPEKVNHTYFVLPKFGEPPQQGATPNAWGMVADINPSYLTFSQTRRSEFTLSGILVIVWGASMSGFSMLPLAITFWSKTPELPLLMTVILSLIPLALFCIALLVPLVFLRKPRSAILLSRELRRFYHWQGRRKGWVALNYDDVTPYVMRVTIISQAGADTSYFLHVGLLKPGTRKVCQSIRLSDPSRGTIQPPAELWEFIRTYMAAPPAKVPPIEFRVPEGQDYGIHTRMDRDMLGDLVDAEHRLLPGLFSKIYFGMLAMMTYWSARLLPLVERKRPQPSFPPALAETMRWSGKNPYRITPPTKTEQKAIAGQLPYMNQRWFIGGLLSTLFWGGSFIGFVTITWRMVLSQ